VRIGERVTARSEKKRRPATFRRGRARNRRKLMLQGGKGGGKPKREGKLEVKRFQEKEQQGPTKVSGKNPKL